MRDVGAGGTVTRVNVMCILMLAVIFMAGGGRRLDGRGVWRRR